MRELFSKPGVVQLGIKLRVALDLALVTYALVVLFTSVGHGQVSSVHEIVRRVDKLEAMEIGPRLAKIETQLDVINKATDHSSAVNQGVLLLVVGIFVQNIGKLLWGLKQQPARIPRSRRLILPDDPDKDNSGS